MGRLTQPILGPRTYPRSPGDPRLQLSTARQRTSGSCDLSMRDVVRNRSLTSAQESYSAGALWRSAVQVSYPAEPKASKHWTNWGQVGTLTAPRPSWSPDCNPTPSENGRGTRQAARYESWRVLRASKTSSHLACSQPRWRGRYSRSRATARRQTTRSRVDEQKLRRRSWDVCRGIVNAPLAERPAAGTPRPGHRRHVEGPAAT